MNGDHQEILIWKYLDGRAAPKERQWLESRMEQDEAFKQMFLECRLLQESLKGLEVDGPSMRFSRNVMDKLPRIRNLADSPLVASGWLRAFYALGVSLLFFFIGGSWMLSTQRSGQDQHLRVLINQLYSIFDYVPAGTFFLGGIIVISLSFLFFLDRWLQTRFTGS